MARYLKQVLVLRKDLNMPTGKVAAMAAHAAITFLVDELWEQTVDRRDCDSDVRLVGDFTRDQHRWLTELDPGLEGTGQVSMAKIVCEVWSEEELVAVEVAAKKAGLTCHRVVDSGHSHNKPGTLVGLGIGPHWPEQLEPVTGKLKVYR